MRAKAQRCVVPHGATSSCPAAPSGGSGVHLASGAGDCLPSEADVVGRGAHRLPRPVGGRRESCASKVVQPLRTAADVAGLATHVPQSFLSRVNCSPSRPVDANGEAAGQEANQSVAIVSQHTAIRPRRTGRLVRRPAVAVGAPMSSVPLLMLLVFRADMSRDAKAVILGVTVVVCIGASALIGIRAERRWG